MRNWWWGEQRPNEQTVRDVKPILRAYFFGWQGIIYVVKKGF